MNKTKLFTLAQSQDTDRVFPISSLKDIKDFHERVEPDEVQPDGEDPITGALAHATDFDLPESFEAILAAVEQTNKSGDLLVGFSRLDANTVKLELWRAPRNGFDSSEGHLGEFSVPNSAAGARQMVEYLQWARLEYKAKAPPITDLGAYSVRWLPSAPGEKFLRFAIAKKADPASAGDGADIEPLAAGPIQTRMPIASTVAERREGAAFIATTLATIIADALKSGASVPDSEAIQQLDRLSCMDPSWFAKATVADSAAADSALNVPTNPFVVYPTRNDDVPEHIRSYQPDVFGAGGVVSAIDDLLADRASIATWAIASKADSGELVAHQLVCVAIGHDDYGKSLRYVGEGFDPNSAGSSAVMIGGLKESLDRAHLSALMMGVLTDQSARIKNGCIFRAVPPPEVAKVGATTKPETARARGARR